MEKQNLSIFNFSIALLKIAIIVMIIGCTFSYVFEKFIINKTESSGAAKIERILASQAINEIPIFGSSRAECSFIPSVLGDKDYFNYGISGAQSNIWLYFLEQELKKDKTTPIIINFDLLGFVSSDGDIANYIPNWSKNKAMIEAPGSYYYHIPFLKYFGRYDKYAAAFIQDKNNVTLETDHGAVLQKNTLTKEKFNALVIKRRKTKAEATVGNHLSKKLTHLIKSTKRTIVFVVTPYHSSYFNEISNFDQSETYLDNLKVNKNVRIFDLRHMIKDDNLFLNTTHLNKDGAIKFSKKMKELLADIH